MPPTPTIPNDAGFKTYAPRRFAIGDVHGCAKALRALIELIEPQPHDEIILLGDYVDRGPDSRDCIDQLIDLQKRCNVIAIRGNHEVMFTAVLAGFDPQLWLSNGGHATLASYGGSLDRVPASHHEFLRCLKPHHETTCEIFVHAGYDPDVEMDDLDDSIRYWKHLETIPPPPHKSSRRAYVGHTPQSMGNVLDWGHLICLDTCCFGGGYLTAMDLFDGSIIQVSKTGHRRRRPLRDFFDRVRRLF